MLSIVVVRSTGLSFCWAMREATAITNVNPLASVIRVTTLATRTLANNI